VPRNRAPLRTEAHPRPSLNEEFANSTAGAANGTLHRLLVLANPSKTSALLGRRKT